MPVNAWRTLLALSLALLPRLLWLSDAHGQQTDRPLSLPKDDVAVTYRYDGAPVGNPRQMQVTYADKGERVRIDYFRWPEAKVPYLALIFDRPADRLISVHPESKSYQQRPIGSVANPGALLPPNSQLIRQGKVVVARAPCTEWQVVVPDKPDGGGTACVTDDGILLRLAATKPTVTTLTATTIHYGPPPDGAFDPPAGFKRERAS